MLKVAMVQQKAVPKDSSANLKLAIQYVQKAADKGADLVLFPEMWSNGYALPFEEEHTDWLLHAIEKDSEYVNTLCATAKQLQIGICATYLAKTSSKPQNMAILIDRKGSIILEYAKVHTCDFSLEKMLQNGTDFKVCEFDGIQIGIMICYDREFPESARVLMLKGAEIILVPNACDMNPARINQLSTRAFENMVGIAMANYPACNWGNSCAFSPVVFDEHGNYRDNTMLKATDEEEQILMAEFDMDEIRSYRKTETWGNAFRKPKAYLELLNETVREPFVRDNED